MQMPIDVKAVMEEVLSTEEARNQALSVSVYFDDTVPGDVQAHVRQAFASSSPTARVSLTYLDGRPFAPYEGDDMAVIVAGLGEQVGRCAGLLREAGVPVMVVTTMPDIVGQLARLSGHPIPDGDLVAPAVPTPRPRALPAGDETTAAAPTPVEPYDFDEACARSLDERMGGWVTDACQDKRLAFALAFPFVRRPLAMDAVNATALQNAGVGLLPIIPGADMPVMTLNQAKMVILIAAAYGEDLGRERVKELLVVVGGGFASRAVARQLVGVVPGVGWLVKGAVGGAATLAMGRAAIQYFEDGASLAALERAADKARDTAVGAAAQVAGDKARRAALRALDAVQEALGKDDQDGQGQP